MWSILGHVLAVDMKLFFFLHIQLEPRYRATIGVYLEHYCNSSSSAVGNTQTLVHAPQAIKLIFISLHVYMYFV